MELGTKQIGNVTVEASEWKKYGKHRIYFKENRRGTSGQACWDVNAGEWVKTHHEFGPRFKAQIKAAYDL